MSKKKKHARELRQKQAQFPSLTARAAEPAGWRRFAPGLAVFLCAFLLRLIHVLSIRHNYPFFYHLIGDAAGYHAWAQNIAAGRWIGDKVFYQDPLYPYFLGIIYKFITTSTFFVRLFQIFLGSLTCVLIYESARRLFGRAVALIAGLLGAAYGMFIFYEATMLKEGLGVFLCAAVMLLLIAARQKPRSWKWFASGIAAGLLILTRGNALLLMPFLLAWVMYLYRKQGMKEAVAAGALFAAGILAPLAPAALHNYIAAKDFVLTTSQAGSNFYIGNHPGASGMYEPLVAEQHSPEFEGDDARRIAEYYSKKQLKPSQVSRFWFGRSLDFMINEPGQWAGLQLKKTGMFLDGYEIPDFEDYYLVKKFSAVLGLPVVEFGFILPFALLGMIAAFSFFARAFPLYVFVVINFASVVLFYLFGRYRLPSVPAMLIFAAFGITALWQWYAGKKWMKFSLAVAALATGLLAVNGNVKAETANFITTSEANLASFYQEQKQYGKAVELLSECLKENPGDVPVRFGLANVYRDLKNFPAAQEQYLTVLRIAPNHTGAMWELGLLYYMKGDAVDARTQWERILSISPAHEKARQGLAILDKAKTR